MVVLFRGSCEQVSQGKLFILSWNIREKSGKVNSAE